MSRVYTLWNIISRISCRWIISTYFLLEIYFPRYFIESENQANKLRQIETLDKSFREKVIST